MGGNSLIPEMVFVKNTDGVPPSSLGLILTQAGCSEEDAEGVYGNINLGQ